MYYQVATEVLIAGDEETTVMRSVHRSPDLALLLNRVMQGLLRKLGWAMTNSLQSDNPAEADVTMALKVWTSYESYLQDVSEPQSSNPPTQ